MNKITNKDKDWYDIFQILKDEKLEKFFSDEKLENFFLRLKAKQTRACKMCTSSSK